MPDGQRVVSGGSDKLLRVWDLASGQCLRTLEGNSEARELKVTPDGRRVVSASGHPGKTISVWDLERERCVRTLEGHCDWVRCLDLTPDGRNLVSGSNDKTLRVWNLESSECLRTIQGHNNYVDGVIVTPDGWRVLSHDDNTMCLWNLENGTCLWTVHDHKAIWIRVTPDGRCAVSNSMRVWDLESGRCLRKPVGHSHHGYSVNVTPDGRRAVLANGKEIRVLDLKSGKYLRTLEGHTCTVQSVSVTPDGRHAVSRSEDYTLRVWDLESGVCLVVFVAPDSVWHVAVSPSMASIVCVLEIGGVMFLESRGIEFGPVICTAAQPSASSVRPVVRCLCCGKEFAIPDLVANVIAAHIALLQPNQSPCLDLPDSAFDDPRLLGTCPHCAHALKFNPFFVEIPAR
jgi:WD40 repeat protein